MGELCLRSNVELISYDKQRLMITLIATYLLLYFTYCRLKIIHANQITLTDLLADAQYQYRFYNQIKHTLKSCTVPTRTQYQFNHVKKQMSIDSTEYMVKEAVSINYVTRLMCSIGEVAESRFPRTDPENPIVGLVSCKSIGL